MTTTDPEATAPPAAMAPLRLHHNAYVVRDQRATRDFYEGVLGLPLVATWCEVDDLLGKEMTYCHTFYALQDGSALAFFQFADEADQQAFAAQRPPSPFIHLALHTTAEAQRAAEERLAAAGHPSHTVDHGYCRSLYVSDPDGLLIELTVDRPDAEEINTLRRRMAAEDLDRWLAGDHTSNNTYRT